MDTYEAQEPNWNVGFFSNVWNDSLKLRLHSVESLNAVKYRIFLSSDRAIIRPELIDVMKH